MSFSVHTIGKSVAKVDSAPTDVVKKKYKNITSRKFFTSVLASKISAYEYQRIKKGNKVGKWVTSCSYDVKEAIRNNVDCIDKEITYRDGSKEIHHLNPKNYGYMNDQNELEIYPHQKRWIRLFNCGSKIQKLTNRDGKTFFADKNHDCGDKMCMRCNRKKSFIDFHRHKAAIMMELDDPVMLVLHQRNPSIENLGVVLDSMYNDFGNIRKQNSKDSCNGKSEKYSYYWSFEMTINSQQRSFHPHFHLITEKRYARRILKEWIKRDPENRTYFAHGYFNDSFDPVPYKDQSIGHSITTEDELIECFKYIVKTSVDEIDSNGNPIMNANGKVKKGLAPIPMIYEMLMSFYGRHRNGAVGSIYNHRLTKEQSKDDIMSKVIEDMKKDGFNENDNPLVDLCTEWIYDHYKANYIGIYEGIEIQLTDYKPTQRTKEYLRINDS